MFVSTGGPFEFIYTDNNSARSEAVSVQYVPPPPLDLEVVSVTGPSAISDGAMVDISWTVRNGGPENLTLDSAWTDIVYLAPNADFKQAWEIGRFTYTSGLNAGRTYTRTERFRMAEHIQGVYRFYLKTDALGQVPETNENNNVAGTVDGTVVALTPRPDLQITSFQAPAKVTSGGVIDVEFTVTNRGPVRTPTGGSRWLDGVYLSLDNKWDGGDRLLGDLPNGSALASGESYTTRGNFQIPLGYGGNFYLLIAADRANAVDEYPQGGQQHHRPAAGGGCDTGAAAGFGGDTGQRFHRSVRCHHHHRALPGHEPWRGHHLPGWLARLRLADSCERPSRFATR